MTALKPRTTGESTKPAEILSNIRGSFAWGVLHDRHPAIIEQAASSLPYPSHIREALASLRAELAGTIKPLRSDAHDAADWARWGRDRLGENWYDVPFLWAESYYYRKLLDAIDYFRPGPWHSIDPFGPQKYAELRDPRLDSDLSALSGFDALPQQEQITAALDAALWGNRADLGFLLSDPTAQHRKHGGSLVADDGDALGRLLADGNLETVCLVADNAGRELIPDLILIDLLLRTRLVQRFDLHLKPQPYYVSDATTSDLIACLRRLAETDTTRPVADRLSQAIADGRLLINTHPFYCAPLTYHDTPVDLSEMYAEAGLVILKGDLNYRRLVGDRRWPATVAFSDTAAYFPTRVATLRTLKSDVVVGLTAEEFAKLEETDHHWRTSGTHGLIQLQT